MAQAQYSLEVRVTRWMLVRYGVPAVWRAMGRRGLRRNLRAWWFVLRAFFSVLVDWRGER